MVEIRLTNTRTRRKEVFEPLDPRNVRMYVCGPTVYDRAHLGNARPVVVFDVLFRLLRHVYGEDHVTYVRNFTDVDDKINARAAETGRPIREITDETIRWFHEDMDALGALRPTREPRATEWIGAMIAMIEELIGRGHAYVAEGHVLFRVRSYSEYGALSGRSVDDMIAGARVEVAPFKEDPLDFVLWKPSDEATPGWPSPWGRGRPGWHIECSAMARELLGTSFDIHGGGLDLQFPHHENEIAQSMCAHPGGGFARLWMHNEMLQVEGEKMSKSLGNFFTVDDLLRQNVRGEVIRLLLLSTHYSKPLDWSGGALLTASNTLNAWYHLIGDIEAPESSTVEDNPVLDALFNDLNTPGALAMMHKLAEAARSSGRVSDLQRFKKAGELLGLLERKDSEWNSVPEEIRSMVGALIHRRAFARKNRDFKTADLIRDGLSDAGIRLSDEASETVWSIAPDEVDAGRFVQDVRSAFLTDDHRRLDEALTRANEAGFTFANRRQLDTSPIWRGNPSPTHTSSVVERLFAQFR